MSGGPSLAAARVGDPISHAAQIIARDSEALLGVALGALATAAHTAGALAAAVGAGAKAGRAPGHMTIATSAVCPITTSGAVGTGSINTFFGLPALPAALASLHDVACAQHALAPIRKGSATVFANGMRLARQTDETGCGAIIAGGLLTVLVGGATVDDAPRIRSPPWRRERRWPPPRWAPRSEPAQARWSPPCAGARAWRPPRSPRPAPSWRRSRRA